jgi:hypothetical protein
MFEIAAGKKLWLGWRARKVVCSLAIGLAAFRTNIVH